MHVRNIQHQHPNSAGDIRVDHNGKYPGNGGSRVISVSVWFTSLLYTTPPGLIFQFEPVHFSYMYNHLSTQDKTRQDIQAS